MDRVSIRVYGYGYYAPAQRGHYAVLRSICLSVYLSVGPMFIALQNGDFGGLWLLVKISETPYRK